MASTSTQMEIDPTLERSKERDDEIEKIIKVINIILPLIGDEKSKKVNEDLKKNIIDLDISDEISGVLMTVFTCLRKEEHDRNGHERYLTYLATIDGTQISIQVIVGKNKGSWDKV